VNLIDLRLAKVFRSGTRRFEPTVDVFNVFNNNAPCRPSGRRLAGRRPSSWAVSFVSDGG
jgi:hypothetical protein